MLQRSEKQYSTQQRRALQPLWNALTIALQDMNGTFLLAVSGGPDSRALMESIAHWPKRQQYNFIVVYIHHGTRLECDDEARAVMGRARVLGFDAYCDYVSEVDVPDEASLREARYHLLAKLAREKGAVAICTAHHADDDAEGFMMHIYGFGGGSEGSAMPAVGKWQDVAIIRPFLTLSADALCYALNTLLVKDYFADSQDEKAISKRAQVRHWILPDMAEHKPNIEKRLSALARRRLEDEQALRQIAEHKLVQTLENGGMKVSAQSYESAALCRRAIMLALKRMQTQQDFRDVSHVVEKMAQMAQKNAVLSSGHLDKREAMFNVTYILPKVRASVTKNGIYLQPL